MVTDTHINFYGENDPCACHQPDDSSDRYLIALRAIGHASNCFGYTPLPHELHQSPPALPCMLVLMLQ